MLRKLNIAIECKDDQQKDQVQQVLAELSGMNLVSAEQILSIYPYFMRHRREIKELFEMIIKEGPKSIASFKGAALINALRK